MSTDYSKADLHSVESTRLCDAFYLNHVWISLTHATQTLPFLTIFIISVVRISVVHSSVVIGAFLLPATRCVLSKSAQSSRPLASTYRCSCHTHGTLTHVSAHTLRPMAYVFKACMSLTFFASDSFEVIFIIISSALTKHACKHLLLSVSYAFWSMSLSTFTNAHTWTKNSIFLQIRTHQTYV